MQTGGDFNQKILEAIHSWEESHDREPPTRLQMNIAHQGEFDTQGYDYHGQAIPIIYSDNVPKGEIWLGRGQLPKRA